MARDPLDAGVDRLLEALDFSAELKALGKRQHTEMEWLFLCLIEVLDSFDRLLQDHAPPTAPGDYRRSVKSVARHLENVLARFGVRAVDCLEQVADHRTQEIVGTRAGTASQADDDVILEVVTRGYEWNGKLLRRARVIVAGNQEE